jgi:hypothetical protein
MRCILVQTDVPDLNNELPTTEHTTIYFTARNIPLFWYTSRNIIPERYCGEWFGEAAPDATS